ADCAEPRNTALWCVNHGRRRAIALDVADHDHEFAVARDELARAVEWIDEENALGLAVFGKGLGFALFGDDGHVRKLLAQALADELIGSAIRLRDWIAGGFEIDAELRGVHLEDQHGRFASDAVERAQEGRRARAVASDRHQADAFRLSKRICRASSASGLRNGCVPASRTS